MLNNEDFRNRNRREGGGVDKKRVYPCGICGKNFPTYNEQKRHLSRAHGKSTAGYDRMLRDRVERKGA